MISIKHTEGVAFIELNAPPVNALGLKMRQALSSAIYLAILASKERIPISHHLTTLGQQVAAT